jgi:hypothetical protein
MPQACGRRKGEPTNRSRCTAKSQETASRLWTLTVPFVRGQNLPADADGLGDETCLLFELRRSRPSLPRRSPTSRSEPHWWLTGWRLGAHRFELVYEPVAATLRKCGSQSFDQVLSEDFRDSSVTIPSGPLTIPPPPSRKVT